MALAACLKVIPTPALSIIGLGRRIGFEAEAPSLTGAGPMTKPEPASGSPPPIRRFRFWKRRRFWLLAVPLLLAAVGASLPFLQLNFGTRLKAENFDEIELGMT